MLASKDAAVDVLTAAKQRIVNAFSNGVTVYLSSSCGKDSITMASLIYDLILSEKIDKSLLKVLFVDEEGIYPEMERIAYLWHDRFESIGVPFAWLCLPFAQSCVVDGLAATESWITWEPDKKDVWIRQPPPFAIMDSPHLKYAGEMNYQTFFNKTTKDGLCLIGIRAAESLTRVRVMAQAFGNGGAPSLGNHIFPIYDWRDSDIWLYIKEHNLDFPDTYIRMYEAGTPKNGMRLCAFFGEMGVNALMHMMETTPELWERVERRIPNAYLAVMYWDSEMFGRNTKTRRELEGDSDERDYRALLIDMLITNPDKYTIPKGTKTDYYRKLLIRNDDVLDNKLCKEMYEKIIYGDPKCRGQRIMTTKIGNRRVEMTRSGK